MRERIAAPADQPAPPPGPRQRGLFEEQEAAVAGLRPQLILTGDSLAKMWNEIELKRLGFAPMAKLAVPGDYTQNVLWRVQNSRLDASEARVTILLAGTNNLTDGYAPADILNGLLAVDAELKRRAPKARRFVLHVPPRDARRSYREGDRVALNALIGAAAAEHGFTAVESPTMDPADADLYRDGLHLFRPAYALLTGQVRRALEAAAQP